MSLDQNSIIEILDDYLVWEQKKAKKKYDQLSSKEKDELRLNMIMMQNTIKAKSIKKQV